MDVQPDYGDGTMSRWVKTGRGVVKRVDGDFHPPFYIHHGSREELRWLRMVAAPSSRSSRLPTVETREIILRLCERRYLTAVQLGELMNRNPNGLRNRFLTPMVGEGLLQRRYPDEPNRPDQAYVFAKRGRKR